MLPEDDSWPRSRPSSRPRRHPPLLRALAGRPLLLRALAGRPPLLRPPRLRRELAAARPIRAAQLRGFGEGRRKLKSRFHGRVGSPGRERGKVKFLSEGRFHGRAGLTWASPAGRSRGRPVARRAASPLQPQREESTPRQATAGHGSASGIFEF